MHFCKKLQNMIQPPSAAEIGTRWSPSARKGRAAKIAKIEILLLVNLKARWKFRFQLASGCEKYPKNIRLNESCRYFLKMRTPNSVLLVPLWLPRYWHENHRDRQTLGDIFLVPLEALYITPRHKGWLGRGVQKSLVATKMIFLKCPIQRENKTF